MWDGIELRELRVFLVLAEELHFGRAAQRLHLTPSRVSQCLRALERRLGGRLVHRTSRRVELTALGERFRDEAGVAYGQLVAVFEQTRAAERSLQKPLRVGLFSGPAGGLHLPKITKVFEERNPECIVQIKEVTLSEVFESLRRGEIDVVATWLPHGQLQPDLVAGPTLVCEPRVLAAAPDHPLVRQSSISLEDVADYSVFRFPGVPQEIHEVWVPGKTLSGRPIRQREARGDRSTVNTELAYLAATGKIVHPTVPVAKKFWGHPNLVYIPIRDMPPMKSALVWQRRAFDPRLREFIRAAREILRPATRGPDQVAARAP